MQGEAGAQRDMTFGNSGHLQQSAVAICDSLIHKHETVTELQRDRKAVLQDLVLHHVGALERFCNNIHHAHQKIFSDIIATASKVTAKELTEFQRDCNAFLSEKGDSHIQQLFGKDASDTEHKAAMLIMTTLRVMVLQEAANTHLAAQEEQLTTSKEVDPTDPGASKIRYLAGRCVAKARYSLMSGVKRAMYRQRAKYHQLREQLDALQHLVEREESLLTSTSYTQSLHETDRRQNIRRSLTNVSDSVFLFFCKVESKRVQLETLPALHMYGGEVISICGEKMLQDENLVGHWLQMFQGTQFDKDITLSIFKDLCTRYMCIANNQYRKSLVDRLGKKKKHAHRVEVQKPKRSTKPQQTTAPPQEKPSTSMTKTSARKRSRPSTGATGVTGKGNSRKAGKGKGKVKKNLSNTCRVCQDEYREGLSML